MKKKPPKLVGKVHLTALFIDKINSPDENFILATSTKVNNEEISIKAQN